MFSAKELAPREDQGVIFGIVESSSNSTIDQASYHGKLVNKAFMATPETDFTFQITLPSGGFSGMVVKPWDERERTVFDIVPEVQKNLSDITGLKINPITPPALPGGGTFPLDFVITSTADINEIYLFSNTAKQPKVKKWENFLSPCLIQKPITMIIN